MLIHLFVYFSLYCLIDICFVYSSLVYNLFRHFVVISTYINLFNALLWCKIRGLLHPYERENTSNKQIMNQQRSMRVGRANLLAHLFTSD